MALYRPKRELERLGDLRVRQLVEERQTQDRRGRLTEAGQLIGDEDTVNSLVHGGMRGIFRGRVGRICLAGTPLQMVGDSAAGDRDEPPGQRSPCRVEVGPAAPGGDEDLLRDICGLVGVAEHAAGGGVDEG